MAEKVQWEEVKKKLWDKYPDKAFWAWIEESFPDGFPVNFPESTFFASYKTGIEGVIEGQIGTWYSEFSQQAPVETAPEAELPGRVTLPSGESVEVDWQKLVEYDDEYGVRQTAFVPILPTQFLTRANVEFVMNETQPDIVSALEGVGMGMDAIYLNTNYATVVDRAIEEGIITQFQIDTMPELQEHLEDLANRNAVGTLQLAGGITKALSDLKRVQTVGGIIPREPVPTAAKAVSYTPGGKVYFADEVTEGQHIGERDVVIAGTEEEASALGFHQWFSQDKWEREHRGEWVGEETKRQEALRLSGINVPTPIGESVRRRALRMMPEMEEGEEEPYGTGVSGTHERSKREAARSRHQALLKKAGVGQEKAYQDLLRRARQEKQRVARL